VPSAPIVTLRYGHSELVVGEAPRIVGTVSSASIPKTARAICDLVELRLDLIGDGLLKFETDLPILLTVRSKSEGGQWTGTDAQRLATYQQFLAHVAAVDIELSSPIAQDVCKMAREAGKASIVSFHDFSATPNLEALQAIVEQAQKLGSIVKIVTLANTERDVEILRTLLGKRSSPLCVMGMGQHAAMTRVGFPKLGSCLTYGYLDKPLAPGQTSAAELFSQLRK
jgi:3-dehydroquinate dehydratase-1